MPLREHLWPILKAYGIAVCCGIAIAFFYCAASNGGGEVPAAEVIIGGNGAAGILFLLRLRRELPDRTGATPGERGRAELLKTIASALVICVSIRLEPPASSGFSGQVTALVEVLSIYLVTEVGTAGLPGMLDRLYRRTNQA